MLVDFFFTVSYFGKSWTFFFMKMLLTSFLFALFTVSKFEICFLENFLLRLPLHTKKLNVLCKIVLYLCSKIRFSQNIFGYNFKKCIPNGKKKCCFYIFPNKIVIPIFNFEYISKQNMFEKTYFDLFFF